MTSLEKLLKEVENLKCVNGAMYFGSVEDDTCNCKTRCENEQTFEHALDELKEFVRKVYETGKSDEAKRRDDEATSQKDVEEDIRGSFETPVTFKMLIAYFYAWIMGCHVVLKDVLITPKHD